MKKITNFGTLSRQEYSNLMREFEAFVKPFAEKHNLQIKTEGGGRYTSDGKSLTFKLQMNVIGADGEVQSKEAKDFLALCEMYGLKKEHLGKSFTNKGETITIIGLMRRRPKYPIQCKKSDGSTILYPADSIVRLLASHLAN